MFRFVLRYIIFIVFLATIQHRITLAYKALCANEQCDVPISEGKTTQFYLNSEEAFLKLKAHEKVKIFSKSKDTGQNGLLTIELNGSTGFAYRRFVKEIKILVKSNLLREIDLPEPKVINQKKLPEIIKIDSLEKTKINNVGDVAQSKSESENAETKQYTSTPSSLDNDLITIIDGTEFSLKDLSPSTTAAPTISQTTQPYSQAAISQPDFQPASVTPSIVSVESNDQGKTSFAQSSVIPNLELHEPIQSSAINNKELNIEEIDKDVDNSSVILKQVDVDDSSKKGGTLGIFDKVAQTIGGIFGNKEEESLETSSATDDENKNDQITNSEELPQNQMEAEVRPSPPDLLTSIESGSAIISSSSNSENAAKDSVTTVIANAAASYIPEPSSMKDEAPILTVVQSSRTVGLKDYPDSKENSEVDNEFDIDSTRSWHGSRTLNSETLMDIYDSSEHKSEEGVLKAKPEIEPPKVLNDAVDKSSEVPHPNTLENEIVKGTELDSELVKTDKAIEDIDMDAGKKVSVDTSHIVKSEDPALVTKDNQAKSDVALSSSGIGEPPPKFVAPPEENEPKKSETVTEPDFNKTNNPLETKTNEKLVVNNVDQITNPKPMELPVKDDNPKPTELPIKDDNPKPTELTVKDDNPKPTELPVKDDNPKPMELPVKDDNPHTTELPLKEDNPHTMEFLLKEDNPHSTELPLKEDSPHSTELLLKEISSHSTELPLKEDNPHTMELTLKEDIKKAMELPLKEDKQKTKELPVQDVNVKPTEFPIKEDNLKTNDILVPKTNEDSKEKLKETVPNEVNQSNVPSKSETITKEGSINTQSSEALTKESHSQMHSFNPTEVKLNEPMSTKFELPSDGVSKSMVIPTKDEEKETKDEVPKPVEEIISKTSYPYTIPKVNKKPYMDSDKINSEDIKLELQLPEIPVVNHNDVPSPDVKVIDTNQEKMSKPYDKVDTESQGKGAYNDNPIKNLVLIEEPTLKLDQSLEKESDPLTTESSILSSVTSEKVQKLEQTLQNEIASKFDIDQEFKHLQTSQTVEDEVSTVALDINAPFSGDETVPPVPAYTNYDEYLRILKDESAQNNAINTLGDLTHLSKVVVEESKRDVLEDSISSEEPVTEPFAEALKNPSSELDDSSQIDNIENQDLPVVLRSYVELAIDSVPDPLYSALIDLKTRGISPGATFLTFSIGFLLVLLISFVAMIKRSNKEGHLLGMLCKTEEKVFKIGTENKILKEELERATTEVIELNENFVKNGEYLKTLQQELNQSKNQNTTFTNAVEKLQTQLDGQRDTIVMLQSTAKQHKEENRILQKRVEEAEKISFERYNLIQQLEVNLKEAKTNLDSSEESLVDSQSKTIQLEQEKDQLLQEANIWNERVQELMNQVESYRQNQNEFHNALDTKQKEFDVLNEAIKKVEDLGEERSSLTSEQYEELVKKLVDVSQMSLDLKHVQDERDFLKTQFDCEKEKGWLLETKVSEIEKQMADAKDSYKAALHERTEAQNKLEVLTNYFKEKELQLQKELGAQEVMRQQKECDADTSGRRLLSLMEENETCKSQVLSLKQELEDTERSYKNLVSTHEKKAHENWLAARGAERKLEEAKREAALLRQRLTLAERDSNESTNSSDLIVRPLPKKLIARNGDITSLDQDAGSDLTDASIELDSSKLAQFRPVLLPTDRPLPPPPPPPFPMPPFGMPPMPPPPGGPFGVPPPSMMPPFPPDPWRFGHPGMEYEDRGRRTGSPVSSRGGHLSPHSSFSNMSRDSRHSSPPPERRRDMFSPPNRRRPSRDSNSPPHLPNYHDFPPHMRGGPNFPPPPHHLGPPRGPPPPLPSHYDRNSPFAPMHVGGMRNDPYPHLYNDTPPDVRRGDVITSSPRGDSTKERDSSKKSSTAV